MMIYGFELQAVYALMREVFDSKVHGANMGPIWGRQDPGGPQIVPMNFAIWGVYFLKCKASRKTNTKITLEWMH